MVDGDSRVEKENNKFSDFGNTTVINVKSIFNVSIAEERVENDANGMVIFQGWAAVGSSESETVWLISKLNYSGMFFTERVWANGEETFDKAWDLKDTYNYSY